MEKELEGRDIYFTKYDNLIPVESLLGLDTPDKLTGGRDTGRTFRRMLLTIHAASANPGHWIKVVDHDQGHDPYLYNFIELTLKKINMDHLFQVQDVYPRGLRETPNLYIRYHPKKPSFNNRYVI